MAQNLINSAGNTVLTIEDGTNEETFGLKFTGKNRVEYGEHRNTNILRLAESFASEDVLSLGPSPDVIDNPQLGQVWFDTTANAIRVYTSSGWSTFSNDVRTDVGPFPVSGNQVTLTKNIGGPIVIQNVGEQADLINHIASTTAHSADDITFTFTGFSSTNVQDVIEEVEQNLIDHVNDNPAHAASAITTTPFGSIGSTNTQDAIEELKDELDTLDLNIANTNVNLTDHINDTTGAHTASSIVYNPFGNSVLTGVINVQQALVLANALADSSVDSIFEDSVKLICNPLFNGFIGSSFTEIPINVVDFGDDLGQVVGGRFTASQNQVVRIRLRLGTATGVGLLHVLNVELRKYSAGGSLISDVRTGYIRNNSDDVQKDLQLDISAIETLFPGENLRVFARVGLPSNFWNQTATTRYSQSPILTSLEVDVLELL